MNERTKTTSTKQSILEEHNPLQAMSPPTPGVLAESIKVSLHPVLPSKSNNRTAKKQVRRGFRAKKATITRG